MVQLPMAGHADALSGYRQPCLRALICYPRFTPGRKRLRVMPAVQGFPMLWAVIAYNRPDNQRALQATRRMTADHPNRP